MAVIFLHIYGKNFVMNFYFPTPNGVCFFKDDKCVLSCINEAGQKKVKSIEIKTKLSNFLFFRGLEYFCVGLYLMFFAIFENEKMYFSKKTKQTKNWQKWLIFASGISFLLIYAYFCVGFLPSYIAFSIFGARANFYLRNFVIAILKIFAII